MSTCSTRRGPVASFCCQLLTGNVTLRALQDRDLVVGSTLLKWQYSSNRLLKSSVHTGNDLARPSVQQGTTPSGALNDLAVSRDATFCCTGTAHVL